MDELHSLEGKRRKKKVKQYQDKVKLEISSSQRGREERMGEDENPRKVCTICKKEFASGKALGGHMRVHAQESTSQKSINGGGFVCSLFTGEGSSQKNIPNYEFQSSETPVCHVCCKSFHSWKSLYGHMRCHSGRGIPVPFDESGHDPVRIQVGPDSGARNGPRRGVDLLSRIAGWPVTGKRGRGRSSPAAEELDILEAAQNLLWLAAGPRLEEYFYNWKSISDCSRAGKGGFCYEEIGVRIERESCFVLLEGSQKKPGRPGNYFSVPKNGLGSELKGNGVNGFQVAIEDGNCVVKEKKKRGRKKKVRAEVMEETKDPIVNGAPNPDQGIRPVDPIVIQGSGGGFRCVTCMKEFSTYQALGAHRSKHYWERNADESCFCHPGPGPENGSTGTEYPVEQESHCLGGEVWAVTPWEAGQAGRFGLVVDVDQHKGGDVFS